MAAPDRQGLSRDHCLGVTLLRPIDAAFETRAIIALLQEIVPCTRENSRACTAARVAADLAYSGSVQCDREEERAHLIGSQIAASLQRLEQLARCLETAEELIIEHQRGQCRLP